ncbi:hypothetical protein [Pseudarthrobacter oxydans]
MSVPRESDHRQLKALTEQHSAARIVEIEVEKLRGQTAAEHLD